MFHGGRKVLDISAQRRHRSVKMCLLNPASLAYLRLWIINVLVENQTKCISTCRSYYTTCGNHGDRCWLTGWLHIRRLIHHSPFIESTLTLAAQRWILETESRIKKLAWKPDCWEKGRRILILSCYRAAALSTGTARKINRKRLTQVSSGLLRWNLEMPRSKK